MSALLLPPPPSPAPHLQRHRQRQRQRLCVFAFYPPLSARRSLICRRQAADKAACSAPIQGPAALDPAAMRACAALPSGDPHPDPALASGLNPEAAPPPADHRGVGVGAIARFPASVMAAPRNHGDPRAHQPVAARLRPDLRPDR